MNRFFAEFRAEITGDSLVGYAHTFGQVAKLPNHYEQLHPAAFERSLSTGEEVVATIEHDPKRLLGSTRSGTLKVGTDAKGLLFEIPQLPDTSYVRDMRVLVERGDLAACSFGFVPGEDEWSRAPDGRQLRTHTSVTRLFDVSLVALPAYEGTEAHLRSVVFETPKTDLRTQLIKLGIADLLPRRGF